MILGCAAGVISPASDEHHFSGYTTFGSETSTLKAGALIVVRDFRWSHPSCAHLGRGFVSSRPATCAKEALARLVSRLTVMTIELMIYLEKQEHGSAVDLKQMTAACSARLEAQEEQARQDSRERLKHLLRERSKQRASERAGERSSERASLRGALAAGNRASDDRLAAPPAGDDRRTKWMQDGKVASRAGVGEGFLVGYHRYHSHQNRAILQGEARRVGVEDLSDLGEECWDRGVRKRCGGVGWAPNDV